MPLDVAQDFHHSKASIQRDKSQTSLDTWIEHENSDKPSCSHEKSATAKRKVWNKQAMRAGTSKNIKAAHNTSTDTIQSATVTNGQKSVE